MLRIILFIASIIYLSPTTLAFLPAPEPSRSTNMSRSSTISAEALVDPTQRDAHYGGNVAQYLVDLHDTKSTFNFCGGMMFQLVLSDALREHLATVAAKGDESSEQPTIAPSSQGLMSALPNYEQSATADNIQTFHGREVRKVKDAAGGMGFALHLSLANGDDPEGWTKEEIAGYDGWKHDVSRQWRTGDMLQGEGFASFKDKFGLDAFTLHHKCYLHYDGFNKMWLSAEDGCEGTPSGDGGMMAKLKGALGL